MRPRHPLHPTALRAPFEGGNALIALPARDPMGRVNDAVAALAYRNGRSSNGNDHVWTPSIHP